MIKQRIPKQQKQKNEYTKQRRYKTANGTKQRKYIKTNTARQQKLQNSEWYKTANTTKQRKLQN